MVLIQYLPESQQQRVVEAQVFQARVVRVVQEVEVQDFHLSQAARVQLHNNTFKATLAETVFLLLIVRAAEAAAQA
jgi:hypothetical protein